MPFVKLDCGILNSTLWYAHNARDIFITALLMAEPVELTEPAKQLHILRLAPTGWLVPAGWYGIVRAAGVGIINRACVEYEPGIEALEQLGAPEQNSRSAEFAGRRLVRINGGFIILNYMRYRDRDYSAGVRQKNLRDRRKTGTDVQIKAQNGRCACCDAAFEQPFNRFVVQDHNHTTGENRGLLCQSCNRVVGQIENGVTTISPKLEMCRIYIQKYELLRRDVTSGPHHVTHAEAEYRVQSTEEKEREKTHPASVRAHAPEQTTPLISRNQQGHLHHTYCDPTYSYCVPYGVHDALGDRLAPRYAGDRDAAKAFLRSWYPGVCQKLVDGFIMGDAFKFWQGRFDATFASQLPKVSTAPRIQTLAEVEEIARVKLEREIAAHDRRSGK